MTIDRVGVFFQAKCLNGFLSNMTNIYKSWRIRQNVIVELRRDGSGLSMKETAQVYSYFSVEFQELIKVSVNLEMVQYMRCFKKHKF